MKQFFVTSLHSLGAFLARKWITKHQPVIIGITGSVGKTSCRMVLTRVLQELLPDKTIYTSPKNFNSELGLVFSLFQIENYSPSIGNTLLTLFTLIYKLFTVSKPYDIIVLEYGIDHPGDMSFLTDMAQPDYSIFTKLDFVHGEYFPDITAIGDEKFILIQRTKKQTYLNASDPYCQSADVKIPRVVWYNGKGINPINITLQKTDALCGIVFDYQNTHITTNLLGRENADYISLGINIAEELGASNIPQTISLSITLQPGRSSLLSGVSGSIILDSSYNASPASMQHMIHTVKNIRDSQYSDYGILCILGDMRELGDTTASAHTNLSEHLDGVDRVYSVGPEMQKYLDFPGKQSFLSSRQAGISARECIESQDKKYIILVKGSQNTIFSEEAVKELLQNSDDQKYLVRQDQTWMKKKEVFFSET